MNSTMTAKLTNPVCPSGVLYNEASYFDGFHFAHIAAYQEHLRLTRQLHKVLLHVLNTRK
jgi:hypothetical protein